VMGEGVMGWWMDGMGDWWVSGDGDEGDDLVVTLFVVESVGAAPVDGGRFEYAAVVTGVDALSGHHGETGHQSALDLLCADPLVV
jgi:hypothetical protein